MRWDISFMFSCSLKLVAGKPSEPGGMENGPGDSTIGLDEDWLENIEQFVLVLGHVAG